jgi:sensor histidine kinase regulating citrate/malate metabolism|tara:strand:+ start:183 stop:518 length:336 start_codon:yes stop_codon:yes gene_type:complete
MKIWNKDICLTNRLCILLTIGLLFSTLVLASVWPDEVEEIIEEGVEEEMWVPTEEDIAYQDSMYTIIRNTQNDITDIKKDIVHILERLDYEDGTYDSIRYVKGGKIDQRRN